MNVKYDAILGKIREDDFDETKDGIQDALSDGKLYGRKNAAWEEVTSLSVTDIQTNIDDGSLTTINTKKLRIYAEQMLPMAANSMYFLQSDISPSQIASHTADNTCFFRIGNIGGQIPASLNTFKFKAAAQTADTAQTGTIIFDCRAAWVVATDESLTLGTAQSVTVTIDANNKTDAFVLSAQSNAITPSGTRTADCELYIQITRDVDDTLAASSKLTFIDIEFV